MKPSTTNSNEIHNKTLTPPTTHHDAQHEHEHKHDQDRAVDDRECDHKLLIISSHQEFSIENAGSRLDKWLEHEPSGREKPAKEVRGVIIPERWGQEDLLKDWMDYSTFDALLAPKEAGSAREALVAEARPNV